MEAQWKFEIKNHDDNDFNDDLERFDEGPQQVTDALRTVQQFDQTHNTEESEESDGNRGVFRGLWTQRRNFMK